MRFSKLVFKFFLLAIVATFATTAHADSKWTTLDGNRIHYYDVGNAKAKDAIVMIHGWTCTADFWKDNKLSGYRVLVIDLPGHGRSDKPRLNYSMEHFARAVNAMMKAAGVKRAVLAGHSMGTPVARQFYRLYPEQTLGIIVVDGALQSYIPKEAIEAFFAPLRTNYKENAAKFVDGMLTPMKDEPLKKMIRDSMLATPDYVAISAMEGMADEKIWTNDTTNVPVLAVMAPSPFWPKDLKEKYTAVAPNINFQMWTGVSHFLHMEKPKEFNREVELFISTHKLLRRS